MVMMRTPSKITLTTMSKTPSWMSKKMIFFLKHPPMFLSKKKRVLMKKITLMMTIDHYKRQILKWVNFLQLNAFTAQAASNITSTNAMSKRVPCLLALIPQCPQAISHTYNSSMVHSSNNNNNKGRMIL
jgi:uncharacterized FlgJ-related protein